MGDTAPSSYTQASYGTAGSHEIASNSSHKGIGSSSTSNHPSSLPSSTFPQASSSSSSSNPYADHPASNPHTHQHPTSSHSHSHSQQQQGNSNNTTFQTPRPPASYQSSAASRSAAGPPAGQGNARNASYQDYQRQDLTGSQAQYNYSTNMSAADGMNAQQPSHPYPHQTHHPRTDSSYSDTPLQPQAPSTTQQGQSSNNMSNNNNNNNNHQNVSYQYSSAHPQRTVSGGFETVKAGPPSPGAKMDLLPYPHTHQQGQHPQQQQQSSHSHQQSSSSHGTATSSRHRSNRSSHQHSNSQSHPNQSAQRPQQSSQVPQTPTIPTSTGLTNTEQPYHEPVAPSSGRSINSKGSSTTSEFTKRKNWSQRIVEEMQDILHVLSPNGTILFVSTSITDLTGLKPEDMIGKKITDFFSDKNDIEHFENEFKNSIMSECHLTTYFRLKKVGGSNTNSSNGLRRGGNTLSNLKEEESDDSGGAGIHNDSTLSNAAAEAVAALNLQSDSLLVEITGTPYYTTTTEGSKSNKRGERRKDRHQGDDYRMAEDGDSESIGDGLPANKESGSSSSGGNSSDVKHKSSRSIGSKPTTIKTCKCFFAMARPYPSRNNATLDTFLELKIENEKLRMKLADIYREIEGDDGLGGINNNNNNNIQGSSNGGQDYSGMGITHADDGSDFQFRNAQNQTSTPYFGADPMAIDTLPGRERQISGYPSRISGGNGSHIQSNNTPRQVQNSQSRQQGEQGQFTYQQQQNDGALHDSQMQGTATAAPSAINGMRGGPINSGDGLVSSAGLIPSTSNTYGALGIGISASARAAVAANNQNNDASLAHSHGQSHHQPSSNANSASVSSTAAAAAAAAEDKKKKMKKQRTEEGEFVCRDCGTVDSPEWRRGPLGPKTLCNACGLRWAKKNKQQQRNSLGGHENILISK